MRFHRLLAGRTDRTDSLGGHLRRLGLTASSDPIVILRLGGLDLVLDTESDGVYAECAASWLTTLFN